MTIKHAHDIANQLHTCRFENMPFHGPTREEAQDLKMANIKQPVTLHKLEQQQHKARLEQSRSLFSCQHYGQPRCGYCTLQIRDGSLFRVFVSSASSANTPEGFDDEERLSEQAQMLVADDEMSRWQNVRMALLPVRLSANDVLAGQKHLPAGSEITQCACMHPDGNSFLLPSGNNQHLMKYYDD